MFGRPPRLAVGVFLGIQLDSVTGHRQTEYEKKLRKRLDFAYQRDREEAKKYAEGYNVYYDQKVRENALEVGDRILVEKVGFTSKLKIAVDGRRNRTESLISQMLIIQC